MTKHNPSTADPVVTGNTVSPKDICEAWAARLNGRQYRRELIPSEEAQAKADGVLIIYGASDDLVEMRGIISDEGGSYGGGILLVTADRFVSDEHECECEFCGFEELRKSAVSINAVWDGGNGYSWIYETKVPHATFDIMEDEDKYCRGIVIHKSQLSKAVRA